VLLRGRAALATKCVTRVAKEEETKVGSLGADPEAMKRYLEAVERKDWQATTAF
jgi:hypothetical protein